MWRFEGNRAYRDTYSYNHNRILSITPIHGYDYFGKETEEILRYELQESWSSFEDPKTWEREIQFSHDKEVPVLAFSTFEEGQLFLSTLVGLFNAPPKSTLAQSISTIIMEALKQAPIEELRELHKKETAEKLSFRETYGSNTRIYIFDMESGLTKIGIAKDVIQRARQIISNGGFEIIRFCNTKGFPQDEARAIETAFKQHFKDKKAHGEFFKISYEEAKEYLQTHTHIVFEKER